MNKIRLNHHVARKGASTPIKRVVKVYHVWFMVPLWHGLDVLGLSDTAPNDQVACMLNIRAAYAR